MAAQATNPWMKTVLVLYCLMLSIGTSGGPLAMRLYFIKGGKRVWLSSWLQTGGWPVIFIPLLIAYIKRKKAEGPGTKIIFMNLRVFISTAVIGLLNGLDAYLYSYGVARLPVTTSVLIIASQLAFTGLFAFILVKQKFTVYSINAVFLLTMGSGVLALHTNGDRPNDESKNRLYILGFIFTLAAAALYGLILPLVELMYQKTKQAVTYILVMEIQLVMCFFATCFCTISMFINKDFQEIAQEAKAYELGEARYYVVLVCIALVWQFFFFGSTGVIFCASSLLSCIIITVFLPVTQILAVIFYHEKFSTEKGVAVVLSLWGFVSYFYGEMKQRKKLQSDSVSGEQSSSRNGDDYNC